MQGLPNLRYHFYAKNKTSFKLQVSGYNFSCNKPQEKLAQVAMLLEQHNRNENGAALEIKIVMIPFCELSSSILLSEVIFGPNAVFSPISQHQRKSFIKTSLDDDPILCHISRSFLKQVCFVIFHEKQYVKGYTFAILVILLFPH